MVRWVPVGSRLRKEFIDAIDLGALQASCRYQDVGVPPTPLHRSRAGKWSTAVNAHGYRSPTWGHSLSAWAYASL